MNNKLLGTLALAGALFMFIGVYLESIIKSLNDTWFTGVWGILYITGWMCSMIVLQRIEAAGKGRFGKGLIRVILFTLTVANVSNVVQLFTVPNKPPYFFYIDLFWPLSNVLMLALGIAVIINKGLPRSKRWIPLACGLWLPLALLSLVIFGRTPIVFFFGGLYSAVMWTILARMVRGSEKPKRKQVSPKVILSSVPQQ